MRFKTSIQSELDDFYKDLARSDHKLRVVTKGGFTQGRAKIDPTAFIQLNSDKVIDIAKRELFVRAISQLFKTLSSGNFKIRKVIGKVFWQIRQLTDHALLESMNEISLDAFYKGADYYTWGKMRVLAIDGMHLIFAKRQQSEQSNAGNSGTATEKLKLYSMLYDTFNLTTIHAEMIPYSNESNKYDLLLTQLDKVKAGDLILLDNVNVNFTLLYQLNNRKIEFCTNMWENFGPDFINFIYSDEQDRILKHRFSEGDQKKITGNLKKG